MSFLVPLGLSLFGLAVPLVLLYFLKVRNRDHKVSSLLLWAPSSRERKASALLQRLERDPFLILQLLALLALAIALARPVITLLGEGERRVVIVLDTSASMKARDVLPSRFEAARDQAAALVRGLGEGSEVTVIEAGVQPRVSAGLKHDRGRALDAIASASARDLPSRLPEAIQTARALIGTDPRAEIHVFTDGALVPSAEANDARIRWVGVGKRGYNVSITNLLVRKTYEGAANYEAFVSLVNNSSEARTFPFVLKVDDKPLARREVALEPNIRRSMVLPFRHLGAARIIAEIEVDDDLAVDNVAYAVLPTPKKIAVTLVSQGNLFLEKALRTDPLVALQVKTPEQYAGGMGDADVVILDSATPPKVGPGRYIFVNTVPPDVPVDILGVSEKPQVLDWDRRHPVMQHVEFSKVAIESAMRLRPLAPGRALVEALSGPLIYALEEPERKAILIGFDLFKADFPLRVAFPLIVSNALRWLDPAGLEHSSLQLAAGQPLLLPVAHGVDAATVTTPSGREVTGRVTRGVVSFTETDEVGLYTVSTARGKIEVAVNLMDAEESDLAPRPLPRSPASDARTPVPEQHEFWPLLVALAVFLLALEALLYWWRRSPGRMRPPRNACDRWALGLRGALLVVLCATLLRPTLPYWSDRINVVFLLDMSDSVSPAARERSLQFVEQSVRHKKPGDHHGVIVFGADAAIDEPLTAASTMGGLETKVDGRGTNILQALQLGLAMLPPGQVNRIVMLSDGRQNAGNALAGAQAVKDAGADLHYVIAPLSFDQEVVAESLDLPQEVKFGEPFYARLIAWSHKATPGRVSLYRNREFLGSQVVQLTAGKNVFSYRQSLDRAGIHVYQAVVEAAGDAIDENNRAVGTVLVRGRPQVLLADKDRSRVQSLAAALRAQSIEVTVVDAAGIPKNLAGLQKYDGIILSNISAVNLTAAQMSDIRDYVREDGGGLIMVGGNESFGLGGYYHTPVEEALPVTMEVKQRAEIPSLAMVVSIDRSYSMTAEVAPKITQLDVAKEAAHMVVDLVNENSEIGVLSFDTEVIWHMPLRPAKNKDEIHRSIAAIPWGRGTDGYPALKEAYAALAGRPAILKHVIFLTDGHIGNSDYQELVLRMAKDQITVSTVGIGKDSETRILVNIANWGHGRFYLAEDSKAIPRIFARETELASNESLVEQPFQLQITDPGHEAIQEIDWKRAPPLKGYVATTEKATASVVLTSQSNDPVLATWRYGLGRAAAFTSDASDRWAVEWLRWRDFNKFWAQLVRWTLRTGASSDTSASVERRDGFGRVTVEAVDSKGRFINFLDAQVGVVAPNKERSVVDLEQVGPGRYVGRFPAREEGVYLVGIAQRRLDRVVGSQVAGLVVPYAQELREFAVDEAMLKELAEITGGAAMAEPSEAFLKSRQQSRGAIEIWTWLVGLAALMIVLDIAVRRFGSGLSARISMRVRPRKPAAQGK